MTGVVGSRVDMWAQEGARRDAGGESERKKQNRALREKASSANRGGPTDTRAHAAAQAHIYPRRRYGNLPNHIKRPATPTFSQDAVRHPAFVHRAVRGVPSDRQIRRSLSAPRKAPRPSCGVAAAFRQASVNGNHLHGSVPRTSKRQRCGCSLDLDHRRRAACSRPRPH